jgi:hypothetical protein
VPRQEAGGRHGGEVADGGGGGVGGERRHREAEKWVEKTMPPFLLRLACMVGPEGLSATPRKPNARGLSP